MKKLKITKLCFVLQNLILSLPRGVLLSKSPSECDLPFLEEVNIHFCFFHGSNESLVLISWLQVLANVKIMTPSLSTLVEILKVLSNTGSMGTQPPCFVRLKSLKVELRSNSTISDEKVGRMVNHLLQNSPPGRVDIIRKTL